MIPPAAADRQSYRARHTPLRAFAAAASAPYSCGAQRTHQTSVGVRGSAGGDLRGYSLMLIKPAVFISSTGDLRSARDLVGKVLHSMGYEPVWQDIEPTDGGDLLDVLRRWMDPCQLMIQLVGRRYGAEPPAGHQPPEFGRVSFTQYEALYFERTLGRKVIYLLLDPSFPTDPASPEPPDRVALQAMYRQQI